MQLSKSTVLAAANVASPPEEATTDLVGLLGVLKRNRGSLLKSTLAGLALAVLYLALATPIYTGTTSLLIDPRARKLVGDEVVQSGIGIDLAMVESQVALLSSDSILRRVVQQLELDRDAEFMPPDVGIIGGLKRLVLGPAPRPDPMNEAIINLAKNLRAKRAQRSYVVDIEVFSKSPVKAARIADAVAQAYLADQTGLKASEARSASQLIDGRLEDLRRQVQQAEGRIDEFKRANKILTADGAVIAEQQLSRLNAELINVRVAASEAKARADQLDAIIKSGGSPDSFTAAVKSGVVQQLRDQQAALARREASLSQQLMPRHPQLMEVRSQLAEARAQIQAELRRLVTATRSEHDVAKSRERELVRVLEESKAETTRTQTAQIRLRELERESDSSRTLLNAYLNRGKETREQQNIATAEARVINPAVVPTKASRPLPWLILSLGLMGGLAFGVSRALVNDHLHRATTAGQATGPAGLRNMATLPAVQPGSRVARLVRRITAAGSEPQREVPYSALLDAVGDSGRGGDPSYRQAIQRLIGLTTARSRTGRGVTIGLVAAQAGHGSTGTALAMAYASALKGERTLLVDLAAADCTLSGMLAPDIHVELTSTVDLRRQLSDLITIDDRSKLAFLPLAHGDLGQLRRSQRRLLAQSLRALTAGYDLTIVDGGALLMEEASLPFIAECDQVLLVVRSESDNRAEINQSIRLLEAASAKLAGVVVTMA